MAKGITDQMYALRTQSMEEFDKLPKYRQLTTSTKEYNVSEGRSVWSIIQNAAKNDERLQLFARDKNSNLLIPVAVGEGKSAPGINPNYLLRYHKEHPKATLTNAIMDLGISPVGEFQADRWRIIAHAGWRKFDRGTRGRRGFRG